MKLYNEIRRFTILIALVAIPIFFLTRDAAAKVQIVASLPDLGAIV